MITPSERHELAALKDAGFTGYLVKPVRAASLAARLARRRCLRARARRSRERERGACARQAAAKGLSILVAEDNEINALLVRALLTRLGHRPSIAGDGEAAVESWAAARAAGSPYDLVLMDVQMPVMDGLEAARRIRAAEAECGAKPARILALTANAYPEDREAASPPAWTAFWSSRSTASACAKRSRRRPVAVRSRLDRALFPHCHKSVFASWCSGASARTD